MLASLLALTRSQELRFKKNEKRDKDVAKLKCGGGHKYIIFLWLMTWKGNAWKDWSDASSEASLVGRVRSSGLGFSRSRHDGISFLEFFFFGRKFFWSYLLVQLQTHDWFHMFSRLAFKHFYGFTFLASPCLRFSHVLVCISFWGGCLEL